MASGNVDVPVQVVKIEPGGKYVLVFQCQLDRAEAARLQHDLQHFMISDQTFAVIAGGGVQLVRVDEAADAKRARA